MLKHLRDNVYCQLRQSPVAGVGIFAVRDIPAHIDPFQRFDRQQQRRKRSKNTDLSRQDIDEVQMKNANVDPAVQQMVRSFFFACSVDPTTNVKTYPVSDPNSIDISFFLNHSADGANVEFRECQCHSSCQFDHIYTTRKIQAGEELLLDYTKTGCVYDDKY